MRYRPTYAEADQTRLPDLASFILSMQRRAPVVDAADGSQVPQPVSGIVYARTKAACNDISAFLRTKDIKAQPYHKGLTSGTLSKTMRAWTGAKPVRKPGEQTKLGGYFGAPAAAEDSERVDVVCATSEPAVCPTLDRAPFADARIRPSSPSRVRHGAPLNPPRRCWSIPH